MRRSYWAVPLILSLILHATAWLSLRLSPSDKKISEQTLEVVILQTPDLPTKKKNLQVVEQSKKALNDEVDAEAKFLSASDQRVAKQTRSARSGQFNNNPGQNGAATLDALKPQFNWNKVGVATKKPPQEQAQQGAGPAQTPDYLKDMELGAQTLLSTREFVYFSYYSRIKRQLQQYWEPMIKDKVVRLLRQGRQVAAASDRVTRLRIILNQQGTLVGVQVVGQSGIQDLDQAAIEAFKAAAPFPNPPKGIVEQDGTIKINWDFVLEA